MKYADLVKGMRMDPDPAAAGGAAGGGEGGVAKVVAGQGAVGEVKVKVGDTEYTQEQAAAAVKQAQEISRANAVVFDGSKSPQERAVAARVVLGASGHPKEEVEAWIKDNIMPPEVPVQKPAQPQDKGMEERMKKMEATAMAARNSQLQAALDGEMRSQLDVKGTLGTLLKQAERLNGEAKAGETRALMQKELETRTIERIRRRVDSTQEVLTEAMIQAEAREAAKSVAGLFSAVIGDPSSIGRASETSVLSNPYAGHKVLPIPQVTPGVKLGALDDQVQNWFTSAMIDLASKTPQAGGTKL